ncbi:MAG: 2,3-bisphosphoglycerate-dependent phosphoglycerate mutase [Candidatus Anoxychlamydiales bacterium]|nr:2,3-bisphosphoglycerate-dependent phosphoglycerate mutase [Candidatus Anoxychlamydiales bacterium]
MDLYLMQHGQANSKELDIEESLSEKGKEIIKNSAIALKKIPISFDVIICSPKKRSKQTAKIVADVFKFPKEKIIETEKIKPLTPAEETLDFISEYERVFIAGHLPSIKEIISYLLYPTSSINFDVQNGGCTKIDIERDKNILKWHLTPNILKRMI